MSISIIDLVNEVKRLRLAQDNINNILSKENTILSIHHTPLQVIFLTEVLPKMSPQSIDTRMMSDILCNFGFNMNSKVQLCVDDVNME